MKHLFSSIFMHLMDQRRQGRSSHYKGHNISSLWRQYKKLLLGAIGCLSIICTILLVGGIWIVISLLQGISSSPIDIPSTIQSGFVIDNSLAYIQSGRLYLDISRWDQLLNSIKTRLPIVVVE